MVEFGAKRQDDLGHIPAIINAMERKNDGNSHAIEGPEIKSREFSMWILLHIHFWNFNVSCDVSSV